MDEERINDYENNEKSEFHEERIDNLNDGIKPFYKRIWFWILVIIVIVGVVGGVAYSNSLTKNNTPVVPAPIIHNSTVVIEGSNTGNKNISNASAKVATLPAGTYYVGKDVQPGLYTAEVNTSGQIQVFNDKGNQISDEKVQDTGSSMPVKSAMVLSTGDKLVIKDIKELKLTPYVHEYKTLLNPGVWGVGSDIKPGNYHVEIPAGSGSISITGPMGFPVFYQALNNTSTKEVQSVDLNLQDGDTITIVGLTNIKLNEQGDNNINTPSDTAAAS